MFWRRFFAGLLVVAGVLGLLSNFVPTPAVFAIRVIGGVFLIAVGLYGFWQAMMTKG